MNNKENKRGNTEMNNKEQSDTSRIMTIRTIIGNLVILLISFALLYYGFTR